MGVGLVIELDTTEAQKELARVRRAINPVAILKLIGMRYLYWIDQNFKAKGIEKPWAKLRPNSRSDPKQAGKDIFPLMRQSFVSFGSAGMKVIGSDAVIVGTENPYAAYHHFGTRPYIIRPVHGKALRFWTMSGQIMRREVHHPGLPSRPLLPSLQAAQLMAEQIVQAYIDRAVQLAKAESSGG